MSTLANLLATVPGVYDDLVDASLPGRTGEPSDRSRDPRDKPAPGNLSVMEHRHLLLRGLRWWVDAVRDGRGGVAIGDDVRRMCQWLRANLPVMAPEDRTELATNLSTWLDDAYPYLGDTKATPLDLPPGAEDQRVRVADAARILGCTVRTIQRRVPPEHRTAGMIRLGDAIPRCTRCDLIVGQCPHTHTRALSR